MNNQSTKILVSLMGLELIAILATIVLGTGFQARVIHTDPSEFLLETGDLPPAGRYIIPTHERHVITNEEIAFLMGDEAGKERIKSTGRILGWRVHFVRISSNNLQPEDITQTVTQYDSTRGAQYNLETYQLSTLHPEIGWIKADQITDIGDRSLLETRSQTMQDGSFRVTYSLSFTYRNLGVRIETVGSELENNPEEVFALARTVITKLDAAQQETGPVPTPTPGFEPPEEGLTIYQ